MNARTEQNSTHTPGPWEVVEQRGASVVIKVIGPDVEICKRHSRQGFKLGEERANARLIAAAPDLLLVSKRMAHAASMDPGQDRLAAFQIVADEARAAIAKAAQS